MIAHNSSDLLKDYRGTNFRGVSRNGKNSWQILAIMQSGKTYLATVDNILYAAILYDILSIQMKCQRAKTNFIYNKAEVLAALQVDNLI